ncbi:MAG: hypothetical protein K2J65_10995 [Duncaniella sp.]|nr:hypothetical protein [Duncaniella sp.]
MPKNSEIKVAANNSTRNSASSHETATSVATVKLLCDNPHSIPTFDAYIAEVKRRFDIECNAKNRAYAFILEKGLLNEFKQHDKEYRNEDAHSIAVANLLSKI